MAYYTIENGEETVDTNFLHNARMQAVNLAKVSGKDARVWEIASSQYEEVSAEPVIVIRGQQRQRRGSKYMPTQNPQDWYAEGHQGGRAAAWRGTRKDTRTTLLAHFERTYGKLTAADAKTLWQGYQDGWKEAGGGGSARSARSKASKARTYGNDERPNPYFAPRTFQPGDRVRYKGPDPEYPRTWTELGAWVVEPTDSIGGQPRYIIRTDNEDVMGAWAENLTLDKGRRNPAPASMERKA